MIVMVSGLGYWFSFDQRGGPAPLLSFSRVCVVRRAKNPGFLVWPAYGGWGDRPGSYAACRTKTEPLPGLGPSEGGVALEESRC